MSNNSKKSPEKAKRLTPSDEILRSLYLRSGNMCAATDCNTVIINNAGVMTGHICHIEAAMPNGARFNPNMTNEQRRSLDNLVLLCATHHVAIDGSPSTYTVAKLKQIKKLHEKRFSEIGDTLKRWFEESYVDNTTLLHESAPKSLSRLRAYYKSQNAKLTDAETVKAISDIEKYLKKARLVPQPERAFMKLLFERAKRLDFPHGKVMVDCDDFISSHSYPITKMKRQSALLDQKCVGGLYEEDEGRGSLRLNDRAVQRSILSPICNTF
jgi:hypothetical protein